MADEQRLMPIRNARPMNREKAVVPECVYMAAYEVYSAVFGPQEAMISEERGCRGGFGLGELSAFLYARAFPKAEWRKRVDEAFRGMNLD